MFSFNFLIADSDDNSFCFNFGITPWTCFTFLVILHLQLVFVLSTCQLLLLDFNLFFRCFLDFLWNQSESSVLFEVFNGDFILLELEIRARTGISQVLAVTRKSFLTNAVFLPVYSSCLLPVFCVASRPIFLLSFCILRESVVFNFITSFCTEINNA